MLPNFFCIGAQKSGTTTLWHLLDAHPQICMAQPRETRHFSDDFRFAEGLAAYELRHFAHWRGEPMVGEKCPDYLYAPDVPGRLKHSLGENLKFLVCLRDPAQRAYSQYRHNVFQLRETRSFQTALAEEAASLAAGTRVPSPFGYLGRGLYAEQIERYFDLFSRERCLLIAFDTIADAQAITAEQVFNFLGVGPSRGRSTPVHAGRAPIETLDLAVEMLGNRPVIVLRRGETRQRSRQARLRRLLGRRAEAGEIRILRPSPALLALAERVAETRNLPSALSPDIAARINHAHFAADLDRLATIADWDVGPWLESGRS